MKNLIFIIIFINSLFISCGGNKYVENSSNTDLIGKQVIDDQEYTLKSDGFDSFCIAKQIPSDINLWEQTYFLTYENKSLIKKYVYAKEDSVISSETFILKLMIVKNDSTFSVEDRKILSSH